MRGRASQAAGSEGRLAPKNGTGSPFLGQGLCRHNVCMCLQQPHAGCLFSDHHPQLIIIIVIAFMDNYDVILLTSAHDGVVGLKDGSNI